MPRKKPLNTLGETMLKRLLNSTCLHLKKGLKLLNPSRAQLKTSLCPGIFRKERRTPNHRELIMTLSKN